MNPRVRGNFDAFALETEALMIESENSVRMMSLEFMKKIFGPILWFIILRLIFKNMVGG